MTIGGYLDNFDRRSRDVAYVYQRGLRMVRWTYPQVAQCARKFAWELAERGLERGDRIVLIGDASAEWIASFFGCALRGVAVVPLDPQSSPDFLARVAEQVQPRLALAGGGKTIAG